MTRYFNTEGVCRPDEHYMVKLDSRLKLIKELYVDRGKYFAINRGRQYGKTTTLMALADYLKEEYIVIPMDFQMMSTANFADERIFTTKFIGRMENLYAREKNLMGDLDDKSFRELVSMKDNNISMDTLFEGFSKICEASPKPIVLMIDEVDSASNNQVFIDFLALLRGYYLNRRTDPIFHSVVLAGVYDIKNLKLKIRPDKEHQYNSPWNIAAEFDVDMKFSAVQISSMLEEFEADHHLGMEVGKVAEAISKYTSGYPYLVSAICKIMDEKLSCQSAFLDNKSVWTEKGVTEAFNILLKSKTTLFDSMIKHIREYPDVKKLLYTILFQGEQVAYNQYNPAIELAHMFGYIADDDTNVRVANCVFEACLYNLFLSEEELASVMSKAAKQDKNQFVSNGKLNMDLVLKKFVAHFTDLYGENDEKFVEEYGRKFFLLYLKPIINGTGNYYIEAQTRDARRTDVIIDYGGEQFIVEMKLWHGKEYNERGEEQLIDYLNYFHQNKGYMLSFNFNKKKKIGLTTITLADKTIVEAVV